MSGQITQSKKKVYCPNCKAEIGFKQHHCPKYQTQIQTQTQSQTKESQTDVKGLLNEILYKLEVIGAQIRELRSFEVEVNK